MMAKPLNASSNTVTTAPSMISLSPPLKSIPYSIQSSSTVPPTSISAFSAVARLRLCLRT
jgi:hypothetical protein